MIELMIALAVIAVLLAVGVPSFNNLIENYRVRTNISLVQTNLVYARTEASKRGRPVTVCRTDDGAACAGSGDNWEAGWLVFVDEDGDAEVDAGTDEILRAVNGLTGFTLRNDDQTLTYAASGAATATTFVLCPVSADLTYARSLVLLASGRPRVQTNVASCPG
ncbi:type IVa pilus pseudopilin TppE [Pseudomaricurvus hydrocarbonicus]